MGAIRATLTRKNSEWSRKFEEVSFNAAWWRYSKGLAIQEVGNLGEHAIIAPRVAEATSYNPSWSYQTKGR